MDVVAGVAAGGVGSGGYRPSRGWYRQESRGTEGGSRHRFDTVSRKTIHNIARIDKTYRLCIAALSIKQFIV